MEYLVIAALLLVILVLLIKRVVSSFNVTEDGPGACQACPPLAAGMKFSSPANGCATTACPTGYTTGTDPTNCTECATGYSKTGTGPSATCTPTVTTCPGHQSVVNNVCTKCNLPTNSIWSSATGCATTACPQNSTANADGTICKCAANYAANSTKTECVPLNCSGRTQISGAPISTPPAGNPVSTPSTGNPIDSFSLDWGKQNGDGSNALPPQIAASAPECAKSCLNKPGCTAFVMDWSNASGSGGDNVGGCTMFSSITPKAASKPRAIYSKK